MKAKHQNKLIQLKLLLKPNITVGEMGKYLNTMKNMARRVQTMRRAS